MMGGSASGCSAVATAAPARRPREGGDHARLRSAARQRIPSRRRDASRPPTSPQARPTRSCTPMPASRCCCASARSGPTTAQSLAWLQSLPDPSARHLDIAQLTARHGFDTADRDRVVRWATAAGLQVTGRGRGDTAGHGARDAPSNSRAHSRSTSSDLRWQRPDGRTVEYRGHTGPGASSGASRRRRRGRLRAR